MKIAVASLSGQVAEHFGHCEAFLLLDSLTGKSEQVLNPGHKPGFLPNFLGDLGVEVIISGGMGGGAEGRGGDCREDRPTRTRHRGQVP